MRKLTALIMLVLICTAATAQKAARGKAQQAGGWVLSSKKSPMEDTPTSTLSLRADAPLFGHYPILKIKCANGTAFLWLIYEPDMKSENVPFGNNMVMETTFIKVKFDDLIAIDKSALHERAERGCMLLDSEAIILIMKKTKKLLIEFPPLDRPKQIATFTMRDFSAQIARLKCAP